MTRKECLEQAAGCVLKDRNNEYGGPEDSFGVIANFWSVYLGRKVYPADVAMMMGLLKIARIKANKGYDDGYIDLAGYAACGAECASRTPSPAPKDGDELVVLWKHKPGAKAEGNEELVVDAFDEARMRDSMPGIVPQDGPSDFDAPQTAQELYSKILESNPAVYGRPRKPTGEELAEMAEEEDRG